MIGSNNTYNIPKDINNTIKVSNSLVVIDNRTNFAEIYPILLKICKDHVHDKLDVLRTEFYNKPCTQLPNIESYMEVIPDKYLNELIGALQYVDAAWDYVHIYTRDLKQVSGNYEISNEHFNGLPIAYRYGAFGLVDHSKGSNKWNILYSTACCASNFRHNCKKAHKMLFTYYCVLAAIDNDPSIAEHEDAQYIIGAIQYATFVAKYFEGNYLMIMFGYVWTLATFFNGFRKEFRTRDEPNTVIPCRFMFEYIHRFKNIDTFGKVNNEAITRYFNERKSKPDVKFDNFLPPSERTAANFGFNCYKFPQSYTRMNRDSKILFFDPHDASTDVPSTRAFIDWIDAVKQVIPSNNFKDILDCMNMLDAYEKNFLIAPGTSIVPTPPPLCYESVNIAKNWVNSVIIPDEISKDKSIWFTCLVKLMDESKNIVYKLYTLNKDGTVIDYDGNRLGNTQ